MMWMMVVATFGWMIVLVVPPVFMSTYRGTHRGTP